METLIGGTLARALVPDDGVPLKPFPQPVAFLRRAPPVARPIGNRADQPLHHGADILADRVVQHLIQPG